MFINHLEDNEKNIDLLKQIREGKNMMHEIIYTWQDSVGKYAKQTVKVAASIVTPGSNSTAQTNAADRLDQLIEKSEKEQQVVDDTIQNNSSNNETTVIVGDNEFTMINPANT